MLLCEPLLLLHHCELFLGKYHLLSEVYVVGVVLLILLLIVCGELLCHLFGDVDLLLKFVDLLRRL